MPLELKVEVPVVPNIAAPAERLVAVALVVTRPPLNVSEVVVALPGNR